MKFGFFVLVVETATAPVPGISVDRGGLVFPAPCRWPLGVSLTVVVIQCLTCSACASGLFTNSQNQSREKESGVPGHINWFPPFNAGIFRSVLWWWV